MTWFYEGKNGWWNFDERNAHEIEESFFKKVQNNFQILICGKLYTIDFKKMVQYRVDGSGRVRRIKRDYSDSISKGVAGLTRSEV